MLLVTRLAYPSAKKLEVESYSNILSTRLHDVFPPLAPTLEHRADF
jgi:hypothetical protein